MKVDFGIYCLGYSVGGRDYPFEIEIEESELEGKSEEERYEHIHKCVYQYVMDNFELCLDI